MHVTLQLDSEATQQVLEGRAVDAIGNNPRAVAGAVQTAYQGSFSRRESFATQAEPGLLLG
jgi:hypothetical protein